MKENLNKDEQQVNEVSVTTTTETGTEIPELSAEQIEFARLNLQRNFNEKFSKWAVISDTPADDDFIALAKKEYEEAAQEVVTNEYELANADEEVNIRMAEFLLDWNTKWNNWNRSLWRGLIQFDRVIQKKIADLKEHPELPLKVDYATLIFLYRSMEIPFGTGLESAKAMAEYENYNPETDQPYDTDAPVTYSRVREKVFEHVNWITNNDKKLSILKQRLDLAYATARMELKIETLPEFIEFHNEITKAALPEDDDELRKNIAEAAQ